MEALVAVTIGAFLILLASTLFLVQNDYYAFVRQRAGVQDNARSVVDLLAAEARSVVPGGVAAADSARLVLRVPVRLAVVCDVQGVNLNVHMSGGTDAVDSDDVSGFGLRDDATGGWSFHTASWSSILKNGGNPASRCAGNGADTTDASDEFLRFDDLASVAGTAIGEGDVLMIYRETEFRFQDSELDTATVALYRGTFGEDLVEYTTGLADDVHFEYRMGDTTHVTSVSSGNLSSIDGIRVVSRARGVSETGGRSDVLFSLTFDMALRNAR